MAALKLTCLILACMLMAAPLVYVDAAISCGQVSSALAGCVAYLRSRGGPVPPACCNGIRGLIAAARTTPDRQTACNCIKRAAGNIRGINNVLASGLPGKCGVNIPYAISPSTNCNNVK